MTPKSELSPEARTFSNGVIVAALALQCALVSEKDCLFDSSRQLAIIHVLEHPTPDGIDPELFVDQMIALQRKKLKGHIKQVAMAFLAKTIERNGGLGTLPKSLNHL